MTTQERETAVVATVLANPAAKLPPAICTALAYAPDFWDSVEARLVAVGINHAIEANRPTHRAVVSRLMPKQYERWPYHPDFFPEVPLPLSIAEYESQTLIQRYAQKRIVKVIADAYQEVLDHPEKAREVARSLCLRLEGL